MCTLYHGITESTTDPPAVPPANPALAVAQLVGRCGGGSIEATRLHCRYDWRVRPFTQRRLKTIKDG